MSAPPEGQVPTQLVSKISYVRAREHMQRFWVPEGVLEWSAVVNED